MSTYTINEPTWAGAEVFEWNGLEGELVATARFVSGIGEPFRVAVRMEDGPTLPGTFTSPAAVLAAVEAARK